MLSNSQAKGVAGRLGTHFHQAVASFDSSLWWAAWVAFSTCLATVHMLPGCCCLGSSFAARVGNHQLVGRQQGQAPHDGEVYSRADTREVASSLPCLVCTCAMAPLCLTTSTVEVSVATGGSMGVCAEKFMPVMIVRFNLP